MLIRWMIVLGALAVGLLYPLHGDISADSGHVQAQMLHTQMGAGADIETFEYWIKNQTELVILSLIILANLVVFQIGPGPRKRRK